MPNRILLFVRHGQYVSTAPPAEEPDGPLTDDGREQAALTAARLQRYPARLIHHSDLQRAVETTEIISAALPDAVLQPSPILRECIPGVPPGFETHFKHIPPSFIEKGRRQARQAFESYFWPLAEGEDERYEIIVSHGNLINYFASRAVKGPEEAWLSFDIQQCGITEMVINREGWVRLVRHNDTGHLPPRLQLFV